MILRRTALAALQLIFFLLVSCASSPEERARDDFVRLSGQSPQSLSTEELQMLASGFYYGVVKAPYKNGIDVFAPVTHDFQKALFYLDEGVARNDPWAMMLKGIILRNGVGLDKDLKESINLLRKSKDRGSEEWHVEAHGELGLALHQYLVANQVSTPTAESREMLFSLGRAEADDYLPAVNALAQIYSEGKYVTLDMEKAEKYRSKSRVLADRQLRLARAKADAQRRMLLAGSVVQSQLEANRTSLLLGIGVAAALSMAIPANIGCTVGCSPPSTVDLINWGVL